ncbi:hypothetical protein N7492_009939 [Penicillium capsulatum]|uniref:Uncharacterized protein n=1 Tax=Penicillium capsulatum TaxID=69766 RepID=A0A9W9LEH6_9EURO|nr:hypothetical protein N7492_009939 [Penicillium capsulatum]
MRKSKLARTLTPLLREPLSASSISRLEGELNLVYPAVVAAFATKHLELITLTNLKRSMVLMAFLEPYCVFSSRQNLAAALIRSCSTTWFNYQEKNCFACIEWKSLEDRETVLSDPLVRKQLKSFNAEVRASLLHERGNTEQDLTWEEDFGVYLESTEAKGIQHRFVTAHLVSDKYLGLHASKKKQCVII